MLAAGTPPPSLTGGVGTGVGEGVFGWPLWSGSGVRALALRGAEVGPGGVQPEPRREFGPLDGAVPARAEDAGLRMRGETPRVRTSMPRKAPLEEAPQQPSGHGEAELQLPFGGGPGVVGVGTPISQGSRFGSREAVLDVLGHAAGAGEEVGDGGLSRVGDDLPGGGRDGGVGGGGFRGDAAIDLRAGVGVDVEAGATGVGGQGVGAAGDSLRLQRRGRPARGHLGSDDAADVALERDALDLARRSGPGRRLGREPGRGRCPCSSGRGSAL